MPSGSGERSSPLFQIDLLGNHPSHSIPSSSSDQNNDQKLLSTPSRSHRQSRASTSASSSAHLSTEHAGNERPVPVECIVCSELADQNVKFEPCMHRIACEDCSSRMKKCLECGQTVTRRITQGV